MAEAPYALRFSVPIYDNRDAPCRVEYHLSEMRYGTVAGALAALFLHERPEDSGAEPWDTRTKAKIPYVELLRARGLNAARWSGCNDKDSTPF